MHPQSPVGLYAWGGPGTIRLLEIKYFHPKIDRKSFLSLYDIPYLEQVKKLFGVTDMWVTFSWGFSDVKEREDRDFIVRRLGNFQQLKIRTHAYIQGFNVVTEDFKNQDIFCRGPKGNKLLYSKGRSFTCPSNPHAVQLIVERIREASKHSFDGIYVDNIFFGLPPFFVRKDYMPFFGCSCQYCQDAFEKRFGYALPKSKKAGEQVISDYITFRTEKVQDAIKMFSRIARESGKRFGINLYDPWWHTSELYTGFSYERIASYLDYLLIENHALSGKNVNNTHLKPILAQVKKPVFVVSYRKGMGRDSQFSSKDFSRIYTESIHLGYAPCYKATEYKTHGVWHALTLGNQNKPQLLRYSAPRFTPREKTVPSSSRSERYRYDILHPVMLWISENVYTKSWLFGLLVSSPLYTRVMKQYKVYSIHVRDEKRQY